MGLYESAVVANDFHIPHHDTRAVKLLTDFIKDIQPDKLIINGDFVDCFMASRFTKHPKHGMSLAKEFKVARQVLGDLKNASPTSELVFIFGNHEWRMEKFILDNARELHGLEGMNLEHQLHLDDLGATVINYHGKEQYYEYGKLFIGHFNKVNKHAGYTAKNLLEDKGVNLMQAHTHRIGQCTKRMYDRKIGAWENGCMCRLDPDYVKLPNWHLGFSIVHKSKKTDHFNVQTLQIIQDSKYKVFYGDKLYQA